MDFLAGDGTSYAANYNFANAGAVAYYTINLSTAKRLGSAVRHDSAPRMVRGGGGHVEASDALLMNQNQGMRLQQRRLGCRVRRVAGCCACARVWMMMMNDLRWAGVSDAHLAPLACGACGGNCYCQPKQCTPFVVATIACTTQLGNQGQLDQVDCSVSWCHQLDWSCATQLGLRLRIN